LFLSRRRTRNSKRSAKLKIGKGKIPSNIKILCSNYSQFKRRKRPAPEDLLEKIIEITKNNNRNG